MDDGCDHGDLTILRRYAFVGDPADGAIEVELLARRDVAAECRALIAAAPVVLDLVPGADFVSIVEVGALTPGETSLDDAQPDLVARLREIAADAAPRVSAAEAAEADARRSLADDEQRAVLHFASAARAAALRPAWLFASVSAWVIVVVECGAIVCPGSSRCPPSGTRWGGCGGRRACRSAGRIPMRDAEMQVGRRMDDRSPVMMQVGHLRRHGFFTGSSGCGKTAMMLGLVLAMLRRRDAPRVVVLDPKGDLAPELLRFLSVLAGGGAFRRLSPRDVVAIRPFGPYAVQLNPLFPVPGLLPAVQAHLVARTVGGLVDGLGVRMERILESLAHAAVLVTGNLGDLRRMLVDDAFRARVASRLSDAKVREYLLSTFESEPQLSRDALRARLDGLLLLPQVERMLCADGCLTGSQLLETGITVVDTGDAPLGMASVGRFLSQLVFGLVAAAVFDRPAGAPPLLVVVDEAHEVVKSVADELERLLTMARFKNAAVWLATQTADQVPAELRPVISTNCKFCACFRATPADLAHLAAYLPETGGRVDPARPDRLLSPAEERKAVLRELALLPERHALAVDGVGRRSAVMRTLALPYAEVARRAAKMPVAVGGRGGGAGKEGGGRRSGGRPRRAPSLRGRRARDVRWDRRGRLAHRARGRRRVPPVRTTAASPARRGGARRGRRSRRVYLAPAPRAIHARALRPEGASQWRGSWKRSGRTRCRERRTSTGRSRGAARTGRSGRGGSGFARSWRRRTRSRCWRRGS